MGEAILYDAKYLPTNFIYDWNAAFNNPEFVDLLINNTSSNSEEEDDEDSSEN